MPGASMAERDGTAAAMLLALVGAALLAAVLLLPDRPAPPALALPLELPALVLLLLAAPLALRGALAWGIALALGLLALLKLADVAAQTAYLRPFNPVLDLGLVRSAWELGRGSLGTPLALAAVAAAGLAVAALVVLLCWGAGRIARLAPRRKGGVAAAALAAVVLVALAARPGTGTLGVPANADTTRLAWEHAVAATAARADLAAFRAEAERDPWAAAPASAILPGLAGVDVLVVFVESYGRSALENPRYAPTVTAALNDGEAALAGAGLAARSGWLTAPMVGGQSWLAHASVLSGLWIDGEGRYRALLASPRLSLNALARRAGWRTAAVMPAITRAWPEAAWFGYDAVLAAGDLGYRGKPFNWVTMPDQFTLEALRRALLPPGPRTPAFVETALISSHAPWTPIPPVLPWDALGDGTVFDRYATAGDPPEVVWRDRDRVREQYRRSLDYVLRVVPEFAARLAPRPTLLVVLGDHQPAAFVSEDSVSRDVPLALIGPPALLAKLDDWKFTPGLVPAADAPVWRMDAFRGRFLAAFGGREPFGADAHRTGGL